MSMSTQPENQVSTQKPAEGPQPEFLGIPVQLDETLPPNTLELRGSNGILRLENVRIFSRVPAAPTPAVAPPIEAREYLRHYLAHTMSSSLPFWCGHEDEMAKWMTAYYAACRAKEKSDAKS